MGPAGNCSPAAIGACPVEETGRQEDKGPKQFQYPLDSHAQQAKGHENKPDQRINQQGQNGQRPAEDKQNTPEQESHHIYLPAFDGKIYVRSDIELHPVESKLRQIRK